MFQKITDFLKNQKLKKTSIIQTSYFKDGFQFFCADNNKQNVNEDKFIFDPSKEQKCIDYFNKKGLSKITINNSFAPAVKNLDFVRQLNSLKEISILQEGLDVSVLQQQADLRWISFSKTKDQLDLSNFPKLRYLAADYKNLKNLSLCPSLRSLNLSKFKESDFTAFKNLVDLKKVFIDRSSITNLKGLENCGRLEHLEIHSCHRLENLNDLPNPSSLKFLFIHGADALNDYSGIAKQLSLEKIQLVSGGALKNLELFRKFKNLSYLQLGMEVLEEDKMAYMNQILEQHRSS